MRPGSTRCVLLAGAQLLALSGCKPAATNEPTSAAPGARAASAVPSVEASPGAPSASSSLPEDSVAAARSLELWREHLQEEERERRLSFDRRKLPEHQRVVAKLRAARATFDGARTQAELELARRSFSSEVPELERRFEQIDHWGNNSAVLTDYQELVKLLGGPYPEARRAALAGNSAEFQALQAELRRRFDAIDASLKAARASSDE